MDPRPSSRRPRGPVVMSRAAAPSAALAALLLAACAGGTPDTPAPPMASAQGASLKACADLAARLSLPGTTITSAAPVAADALKVGGVPAGEHCLVVGRTGERKSGVDGQTYAIGWQMRLPMQWNGRFYHQGNGGLDGIVANATGPVGGGGEVTSALQQGFAVLSSDAGHNVRQLPFFAIDPDARLDYGYRAVATMTPVGRGVIAAAYGKQPDRSYFGGCSNGGRHAMVAASRYFADYDGFLAGNPGFNLPKAALAQLWGAQQYQSVATTNDLASAFTPAERQLVARSVLARCDALDGLADGLVGDVAACQKAFDVQRDVPSCTGARDGSCLSAAQKGVLQRVYAGPNLASGAKLYSPFPWDPGIASNDWASWKFVSSVTNRDPVAVAFVFQTPPAAPAAAADPRAFAMNYDIERNAGTIFATSGVYSESSMQFMTPPNADDLTPLKRRGAKLLVYHGVADGVFSTLDTVAWWERLNTNHARQADRFARLFVVPGMAHCRGGPATDRFDALSALVKWVEQGEAPERIVASARGAGDAVPNPEQPAAWAPSRTRPLCAWPKVARYTGSGDPERAENFQCR